MHKSKILITCPKGIPAILEQELVSFGFTVLTKHIAGVETEGTLEDTQRLNMLVRTGHRVLFLLEEFTAKNADDLYNKASAINWECKLP
ncbi:MAG: class I SAM-dependent RNA methyltransferase, partial [Betaproteobacteria bacterium]